MTQRNESEVNRKKKKEEDDDPVAQPVEHLTFNQRATGSNPVGITKEKA